MIQADVLAVLRRHGGALSAYDVLAGLREAEPGIAPPTIYRALAALIARGRVHRLESLNKFMACRSGRHRQASVLSICGDCGAVEESVAPDLPDLLSGIVGRSGFRPARHVIEIHGLCASCGGKEVSP
jgi:Fur family zinc uptake transcriptional regulator